MKKLFLGMALFMSLNTIADTNIKFDFSLTGTDIYTIEGNKLTGESSSVEMSIDLQGVSDGRPLNINMDLPAETIPNTTNMEILNKKQIRMVSTDSGIDTVIDAKIKRTTFGKKLKGLTIPKEVIMSVMAQSMAKSGEQMLTSFGVSVDGNSVTFNIEASDSVCIKLPEQLECTNDLEASDSACIKLPEQLECTSDVYITYTITATE